MASKTIIAQFVLLATFLLPSPCMAQIELRALSNPIGANGKPCIGIMFDTVSRDQKKSARELARRTEQYKPLVYHDAATKTLFYLESDRQHLSAIGSDGKVLWMRSWNMCPYRVAAPHIVSLGYVDPRGRKYAQAAEKKWTWLTDSPVIRIYFNSSQFGLVNQRTGDFFFEGQN